MRRTVLAAGIAWTHDEGKKEQSRLMKGKVIVKYDSFIGYIEEKIRK